MDNAPVAPTPEAPAPEASVATPETTNPAPAPAPEAPAPEVRAEQVAKYLGTDLETLEKFNTFVKNNGQFNGAFKRMKEAISAPKPQEPQQQPAQAPAAPQAPSGEPTQPTVTPGTYSLEEMAALSYFDRLASSEKYANIADDIRSGEVLKGLKDFNITPIKDGRINDADVRKYLDLYAATKPAKPTSAVPTAEQQVEYVKTGDAITSMEEATKIQLQNIELKSKGLPLHPKTEAANAFVREFYREGRDKK